MNNIYLIVNPKSGTKNYNHTLNKVITVFKENNIEYTLIYTEYAGHAIELVRSCNFSEYDSVCTIGLSLIHI